MIKGRIHSIETMGTVDGPGIRYVVFTQGCPLRCIFCHNRDTWDAKGGEEVSVDEMLEDIKKYIPFMKFSGGGVTATGGEPTLQPEFVNALFKGVKEMGLNTALDTSGFIEAKRAEELLRWTDLVLLSIKHVDSLKHQEITGVPNNKILSFMDTLREKSIPVWIRYVIIPGWTDDLGDIRRLAALLQGYPNIEKVEVLPYHTLGVYKWEQLGQDYRLKDVESPGAEKMEETKAIFREFGLKV